MGFILANLISSLLAYYVLISARLGLAAATNYKARRAFLAAISRLLRAMPACCARDTLLPTAGTRTGI